MIWKKKDYLQQGQHWDQAVITNKIYQNTVMHWTKIFGKKAFHHWFKKLINILWDKCALAVYTTTLPLSHFWHLQLPSVTIFAGPEHSLARERSYLQRSQITISCFVPIISLFWIECTKAQFGYDLFAATNGAALPTYFVLYGHLVAMSTVASALPPHHTVRTNAYLIGKYSI